MKYYHISIFALIFIFSSGKLFSQEGKIHGKVYNSINNEALSYVSVAIPGTTKAALTDSAGYYEINGLTPGYYDLSASFVGYETMTINEIAVSNTKHAEIDFELVEKASNLKEVEIKSGKFIQKEESPVSLRTIGVTEISRSPGGNRDISKVIQSFPGVAPTTSYRNDIIVRGGAPNENRFYLDGIEVPNINHFATQGSSGGPVGMINVDFIREVEFYSGAFPANKNNALSSVMEFKFIDGRDDRIGGKFTLGASDIGLTLEGPANKNASFLASVRRSYLQLLFSALGLPFLPTYNDFQAKYKWKINTKNEISFIGLGAIDVSTLNTSLQENGTEQQKYILGYLPEYRQWNYTNGLKYVHYTQKGYVTMVLSRNMLNNESYKFKDNIKSEGNKILDYKSYESENKFRIENTRRINGIKLVYGGNLEYSKYSNATFQKITGNYTVDTINFSSVLHVAKYGLFAQASKSFMQEKMSASLGIRTDAADFSASTKNIFKHLSPRVSLSIVLTPKITLNANAGIYFQLPAYTVLGYRNSEGILVNRNNNVGYIRSTHFVTGIDYFTKSNLKVSLEGFLKLYDNYPFIVRDSISLANLGSDFGVIGNTEVVSSSVGRSYGIEFLAQQKLFKGFYGIATYTFVRSEFKDKHEVWTPSSWDNIHIINLTMGKTFGRNWEVGVKWRFAMGSPYTPYNVELSRTIAVWNINRFGVPDYNSLNSERLPSSHQLDIRVDKKVYLKKLTLDFYVDIQNLYGFKSTFTPLLNVVRDENNNILVDPSDPSKYQSKFIENKSGQPIPSIGITIEF
jgi:hypothetical protein